MLFLVTACTACAAITTIAVQEWRNSGGCQHWKLVQTRMGVKQSRLANRHNSAVGN